MKNIFREIAKMIGLLPYLHFCREKYFPTEYYKKGLLDQQRYVNFYSSFINKGDLCFDIGAHKGHRTEIFLKLGARVLAVEPQLDCFKYLQIKFGKKIQIENCGLGSKIGIQEMFINSSSSLSTFSKEWADEAKIGRFSNTKWISKRFINIRTLDFMIEKYGLPKFCKIDVETYEYEVMKGLTNKIEYISFEFMLPENYEVVKNCMTYILKLNPDAEFNYSLEDNLQLELEYWLGLNQINEFFDEHIFKKPSWGDVYVRMK